MKVGDYVELHGFDFVHGKDFNGLRGTIVQLDGERFRRVSFRDGGQLWFVVENLKVLTVLDRLAEAAQ